MLAAGLLLSRGLPVVTTAESCSEMSSLASVSWMMMCAPNFNAVYTTNYSVYNASSGYDPWPWFTWSGIAPNGRSVLLYPAALLSALWAVLALRRARELPTFWHHRAKRRRMRIAAGLVIALITTALVINVAQVQRFRQEWTSATCGGAGWCSASTQWGLYVLVAIAAGLVLALVVAASSLETNDPSAAELRAASPGATGGDAGPGSQLVT